MKADERSLAQQKKIYSLQKKMVDKCENHYLEMESYSRSRNLRLEIIKETSNENCKKKVCLVFKKFDFNQTDFESSSVR